jgi:hypothetical protein
MNCWSLKYRVKEAYQCFHQLSQQGHLASIVCEGYIEFHGLSTAKNEENGRNKMLSVLTTSDGYWTFQYSEILFKGLYGFSKKIKEAERLKSIWKIQPMDPNNYFHPSLIDVNPWKIRND